MGISLHFLLHILYEDGNLAFDNFILINCFTKWAAAVLIEIKKDRFPAG